MTEPKYHQNWQAARQKRLGTARERQAAFAMFAPDTCGTFTGRAGRLDTGILDGPQAGEQAPQVSCKDARPHSFAFGRPPAPTVSPPFAFGPSKSEANGGAPAGFHQHKEVVMSDPKTQDVDVYSPDQLDPVIVRNTGSLAQFCDPGVVAMSPSARIAMGYEPQGPCDLLLVYGHMTAIGEGVELPKEGGEPAEIVYSIIGNFEVMNIADGRVFNPRQIFFPRGFHDRFLEELRRHLAEVQGSEGLELRGVFSTFVRPNAKPPNTPWSWQWRSLLPPKKIDPLAVLRRHALKQLAAQKAERAGTVTGTVIDVTPDANRTLPAAE